MEIKLSLPENKLKENIISIILCAGEGKRISDFIYNKPKPLININNKPLLQGHLKDKIENYIFSIKSKDTSLQNIITLIDTGTDYKKGPLYSFLSITKEKSILKKDTNYLVFPGDTYFDYDLMDEIFTSIRENYILFERYPIMFYQKLRGISLKSRKSPSEFISVIDIEKKKENFIVKEIQKRDLSSIDDNEYANLVIPVFAFNYRFINQIMKVETNLSVKTIRGIVNFLIKKNELVYALPLNPSYDFFDIDTKSDLMMLHNRKKKRTGSDYSRYT
jgi:NDP-sugar pyrophosphorylase family protein